MPCLVSALIAYKISGFFGYDLEIEMTLNLPEAELLPFLQVAVLGVLCALLSILYIFCMDRTAEFLEWAFKNSYLRIAAGGYR